MVTTTAKVPPKTKTAPAFPAAELEAAIRECLDASAQDQAVLLGSGSSDGRGDGGTAIGPQPVIDSLVVVEVLCGLEPMVPFELPDSLVRGGGYPSVDEAVGHLMPQLQKKWEKHHKGNN